MSLIITFSLIGISILTISKIFFGSFLAPVGTYATIWCLAIIFFQLRVIEYYDLNSYTIACIIISVVSFLMGSIFVGLMSQEKGRVYKKELNFNVRKARLYLIVISVIGLLLTLWYLYNMVSTMGGITYIFIDPKGVRAKSLSGNELSETRNIFISIYGLALNYAAAILGAIYMTKVSYRFIPAYVPLLSLMLYSFLYLGRTIILEGIFCYLITIFFTSTNKFPSISYIINNKKGLIRSFVFIFLPSLILIWYLGELLEKYKWSTTYSHSLLPPLVIHIYDYFCSPLGSLNYGLNSGDSNYLWGWASFYPIMYALFKVGIFSSYTDTSFLFEGVWIPNYTNVSPAIRYFYEDFGLVGVIVIPFILGFVSSFIYKSFNSHPTLIKLNMLVLLYISIIFSIMDWRFWYMYFMAEFLICLALGFFLRKKISYRTHQ